MALGFRKLLPVFFIPLFLLSTLKGLVGTDTLAYYDSIRSYLEGWGDLSEFEPGFYFLIKTLSQFIQDPIVVINIVAGINAILFFKMLKGDASVLLLLVAALVPAFYYDFTMNGLRMGFALPLTIMAYERFISNKKLVALFYFLIAFSFHYSAIFLLFCLVVPLLSELNFKKLLFSLSGLVVAFYIFGDLLLERLVDKVDFYGQLQAPGTMSGGFPLLLSVVLLLFSLLNNRVLNNLVIAHLLLLILQMAMFGVTTVSYGGLRLQLIVMFSHVYLYCVRDALIMKRKALILQSFFFFTLFASWKIRAFLSEQSSGSTFLPYLFIWEIY